MSSGALQECGGEEVSGGAVEGCGDEKVVIFMLYTSSNYAMLYLYLF